MSNRLGQTLEGSFFILQLKGLLVLALLLVISDWGFEDRLDIWLADQMFDFTTAQFPLKESWFAATVMHVWLKHLMLAFVLCLVGLLAYELLSSKPKLNPTQLANLKIIVSAAIILPLLVGVLKAISPIHCPWDLARYGGHAVEFSFGHIIPEGKCFPAGHVTSTSWLMALVFIYLPFNTTKARWVWALTFGIAFTTGWVQQLRGAHFLCHTLWSLWLSWAVIVGLAYYFRGKRYAPSSTLLSKQAAARL
ncbi:phosphatase PAP2 family protein [Thiofilum flexile]|uniref:phosphatase PAP2 family protein n=1 Tax=Thiofilum flexile TaxID=125627 RepID=UPI000366D441|nr:phosphatase PAP2 family protein [Thiofilum flexile]